MDERWLAHLEKLAALDLDKAERQSLCDDLTRIIAFAAGLPECSSEESSAADPSLPMHPINHDGPAVPFLRDAWLDSTPDPGGDFLRTPPVWKHGSGGADD